ncbi:BatA domain-containing protein [Pontibacter sp. SGAir0037]|uniref:BatA domain-containing protein n=1 Tax=Pontibacter sp. SGAir0037 TaxID=2571030 RepID=UPI00143E05AB|nr:BatA domain-containing protein [Pontibacter sp. SGAir0037]
MFFSSPYWLLATSAILIPIAIHLWNKRQGKTVKVGSLRWLEASASKQWSSIKLNDLWLLLLRCTIVLLLAMALAAPFLAKAPASAASRKAVYVSPELLYSTSLSKIAPAIDALLLRGYSLHEYAPGFAPLPQAQWQVFISNPKDSLVAAGNHWGLLPALAQQNLQPQDSVWLFTSDQQRHFIGARPAAIPENINWIPVTLEASTTWIQTAARKGPDSLRVVLGHSNHQHTFFSSYTTVLPATGQSVALRKKYQLQLEQKGDSLWVKLDNPQSERVPVLARPLRYTVYAEENQQTEMKYLQAAVQAISHYTAIPMELQQVATPDTTATMAFWLRKEAVPTELLQQVEQKGMQLWLQSSKDSGTSTAATFTAAAGTSILIEQLNTSYPRSAFSHWQTDSGEPLLAELPMGRGKVYYFQSGFSPAWSGLGQHPLLPELLLPILLPNKAYTKYDMRLLAALQFRLPKQAVATTQEPATQQYPLAHWLVLAAFILFIAERIVANRKASKA